MDSKDLIWVAGFLEGDGHFGVNSTTQEVEATQKNSWTIEKLQRLFGGSVCHAKGGGDRTALYWRWRVTGARARGIMLSAYELLSPEKQLQIRDALALPGRWRKPQRRLMCPPPPST